MDNKELDSTINTALHNQCWFCKNTSSKYIEQSVYKITDVQVFLNRKTTKYAKGQIKIPICESCNTEKEFREKIEARYYLSFLVIAIGVLIQQSINRTWTYFFLGLFIGLITVNLLWAYLAKLISEASRKSDINFDYDDFPLIKLSLAKGWNLGEKP